MDTAIDFGSWFMYEHEECDLLKKVYEKFIEAWLDQDYIYTDRCCGAVWIWYREIYKFQSYAIFLSDDWFVDLVQSFYEDVAKDYFFKELTRVKNGGLELEEEEEEFLKNYYRHKNKRG